ncbi:uncharacterized protein LOC133930818 [Phragmites australis]|uniref:uncharacterized protein LOC133930818 n=1 Tax=Phragmites australis TaxID=29695 RepID=UPI002D79BEB1|nr:uncharacterized protein LOC133930818 [Phragmites australis]
MAKTSLLLLLVHVLAFLHSCTAQSRIANISVVEAAVRDRAFELLRRTSQLVDVPLPANLSAGVEASALRVRSNELWADGVNATGFTIPPRVVPAPFARRVAIIFEHFDVGNGSSTGAAALFAAPPGYALAAPVVGLLAYDASAGLDARVALQALGAPVHVEFKNLSSAKGFNATTARCLTFSASGEVVATHAVVSGSACAVPGTGHFGVAVRVPETPTPAPAVRARCWAWTVGVGASGVLGASFLALSVAGAVRWSRRRRREEMERRAMAGEELGRMTVRGSRMPSAKVVRTQPAAVAEGVAELLPESLRATPA